MKRIAVALLALVAAASCARKPGGAAAAPEPVRTLRTAVVERRVVPGLTDVEGVVVGREDAILSTRLAATVAEVRAVPGQTVRAGAVLVRLEQGEADAALEGARANLAASRSALDLARRNRARYEKLEAREAAAAVELERARQEEASAAAGAASAEAVLRRAETDRAQAVMTAPFDAVIVEKMVSPGDLAAPGRPLVRLASVSGRRVEAAPGEQEAAHLAVGDPLEVVVAGRARTGRVAEIVGAIDPSTRRRTVRIDLPQGDEPPVGSFARVRLPGAARERLVVPESAVVARGGLEMAWTAGADGRLALRYVRTGARMGGGLVEVRSGLDAGDRVVLEPPADLEAGTRLAS